jgi:anion-transporting  ArsA/GET3 family ATPase
MLADKVLGTAFLTDTARFFLLLQNMYDGFVERAKAVGGLLSEESTTFMIVTTPEEIPLDEAARLVEEIERRGLHLGVMVANKVLPDVLGDGDAAALAHRLLEAGAGSAASIVPSSSDEALLETVLSEMATNFLNYSGLAITQAKLLVELSSRHEVAVSLPHLLDDVVDLEGLATIGDLLFGEQGETPSS